MNLVRLARSWNGGFTRSVRDDKGEVIDILRFEPGEVLELDEIEFAAVQNDLGKALEEVELVDGKFRPLGFESQNPKDGDGIKKSPRRTLAEQQAEDKSPETKKERRGKTVGGDSDNTSDK